LPPQRLSGSLLIARAIHKRICKIDNKTLELCQSYAWRLNIREFQNIVERSVIFCSGDIFWIEKARLASVQPRRQELAGSLPDTLLEPGERND
jgi:DNA-binding NtrC family response regulator